MLCCSPAEQAEDACDYVHGMKDLNVPNCFSTEPKISHILGTRPGGRWLPSPRQTAGWAGASPPWKTSPGLRQRAGIPAIPCANNTG